MMYFGLFIWLFLGFLGCVMFRKGKIIEQKHDFGKVQCISRAGFIGYFLFMFLGIITLIVGFAELNINNRVYDRFKQPSKWKQWWSKPLFHCENYHRSK